MTIDWTSWTADAAVAITYVRRASRVLLIHKKRGLGAGLVNGPGGRLEPGETPAMAAARELTEEVGLTVTGALHRRGEHRYQFLDGFRLHLHAFVTEEAAGEPVETDEARPFWAPVADLPLGRMWEDTRLWLPAILAGEHAVGRYVFDGAHLRQRALDIGPGLLGEDG